MFGYIPKFHLKYRVFLNNWSGLPEPQGSAPSFVVPLDGFLSVEKHVKNGMKGVAPPERSQVLSATRRSEHTESMKEALDAANNLQNFLNIALSKKPVNSKRNTDVSNLSLEGVGLTSDVSSLLDGTSPGTVGLVGEAGKRQNASGDSLDHPPIQNSPSTGEGDNGLKPSTTDTSKDVSEEVSEVANLHHSALLKVHPKEW